MHGRLNPATAFLPKSRRVWSLPAYCCFACHQMYSLDFTEIKVTEDAIQRERDAVYADYI